MRDVKTLSVSFAIAFCLCLTAATAAEPTPLKRALASQSAVHSNVNSAMDHEVHHELLLCDLSAPGLASDCSDMGPAKLQQLALRHFEQDKCFVSLQEHSCALLPEQHLNFIVVYAASATVEHWRAHLLGQTINLIPLPVTPALQQLADQAQQLHQQYPVMQQYYSFSQLDDGTFINELGNIMDASAIQAFTPHLSSFNTSFGDCRTALDYMNRMNCNGILNNWIRGVDQQYNTPPAWWHNILDTFSVSLSFLQIGLNHRRLQPFSFTLRYRDGSLLVLTITPLQGNPGAPRIVLDKDASRTSHGNSFTAYQAALNSTPGLDVSPQEAQSIFAGTGCNNITQIIGQEVTYLITIVTLPDGTRYISAVQKEGSVPIMSERIICDMPGLPPMF